jgi:polyhydroxyalkanoate synthesis regulator phasin
VLRGSFSSRCPGYAASEKRFGPLSSQLRRAGCDGPESQPTRLLTSSQVVVNSTGKLGIATSSARFKEAIKSMEKASEAILALKPVTFHYKEDIDPDGIPQFGLVAEEVEKVNPDLVARGEDGKIMAVRYEAVNAMLLNEFLKGHRKVEEQSREEREDRATISQLKSVITQQQNEIEALTATIQKVSNRVALSKPAPQLVANP